MSKFYAEWPDGLHVIWRNLTKSEFQQFKSRLDNSLFREPMDIALDLYRLISVDGPDPKFIPAGIPAYIYKHQLLNNPFGGEFKDVMSAMQMARTVVSNDYFLSATALISNTLNYKPEDIEEWEPNKFFIRLAQAELVSGRSAEPIDPKAVRTPKKPSSIHKALSQSQYKALERTRERDRTG